MDINNEKYDVILGREKETKAQLEYLI
jgi:hypothetical protein